MTNKRDMSKAISSEWLETKLSRLTREGKEAKEKLETFKNTPYFFYWQKKYDYCRKWWLFYKGALKKIKTADQAKNVPLDIII